MNVKKNDTVIVLSGKDKGKKGKVLEAMPAAGKVVVEGINVATCHVKPKKQGDQGGIVSREIPMYASKVMLVCPKCGKKDFTGIRQFNLMFKTHAGVMETPENEIYLPPGGHRADWQILPQRNYPRQLHLPCPRI